ncbi:hypothetical protein F0562_002150 [Nyssa sinensis]|uniref:Bromo domain-containing protein n=1 Tax=Nyssa sinensis TaxID=561372 RepID=A0A5J5C680_9ASTE|nr:hypothetical protein F0562_002150 [Nyssa sinensis]
MLEGQKRKSARILALEASNKKKKEENKNLNTQPEQEQEQVAEASQRNAATPTPPPPPPAPPVLHRSGSGQPLPEHRRGRKKKRLDEVAASSSAPTTQQNEDKPKHEDPPISNATLPSVQRTPEKRILEFILDILQRRDTHEIFAQPVDPKEVEGYYDIIEKPMDFGTMRAKLQEGMYTTLEQFENDVFLISSNAMHFNSSATIYFRQARAIHELAKRVFNTLKTDPQKIEDEFLQTRRRGRKPRGETGASRTKLSNNLRRNIRVYWGSSSSNPLVDQGGVEILPGTERRQTYNLGASLLGQNKPIISTVYKCSKQLVPDNGGAGYKESLMQFAKDLGPTAQMVVNRKLRCLEAINYQSQPPSRFYQQSQTPTRSAQYPNYLISSPASQGGLTCIDGVINNQMPRRLGIEGAAAAGGKSVLIGDRRNIHGGANTGMMALASDRMSMHGAASKGKGVLIGEGMDISSGTHGGKMALPSGRMDIHGLASKGKNVLIDDGMDIYGGTWGGKMNLPSGRLDKGKNVLAGDSTDIYDGTCGEKLMAGAIRAAYKGKNVLTSDSMNMYGGVCRDQMALTNASSRVDIHNAASKLKNIFAGESMDIYNSAFGGKMNLARGRADGHGAFREAMGPPVDIMGIRIQGERAHAINREAIDSSFHGGMAVNTSGIRDAHGLSRGMIQPSDERGFLQAVGDDVAHSSAGIREAFGAYYMDLLRGAVGEDGAYQNQNIQNQLGPYLPSPGTANLRNPIAGIKDTSERYVTKDVVGSSQLGDRVHPVQLASESQPRLPEFMFRGNQHPKSIVHPSKFIKPSSSDQTSTSLHAPGSHSLGGLEQTIALPNRNYGDHSAQVSQAVERTQPALWGLQGLYDFPQFQPRFNLLGKNALVQQELQFPLDDQDALMQRQAQLTSVPYMQTQISELDPLGQGAFVPQQSQLAPASFLLPTEVNLLGEDVFPQRPNLFAQNIQQQGWDAFAQQVQLAMVPCANANPLGEDVYMQQDPQVELAQYMQQQQPQPGDMNLLGEAVFLPQETQLTVPPQPQGQILDAGNFCRRTPLQGEGAETDAQSIWDDEQQGNQHPDLALQL